MSRRSPFASGYFLRKERRRGFIRGARINNSTFALFLPALHAVLASNACSLTKMASPRDNAWI
jgi:hypothetical protein